MSPPPSVEISTRPKTEKKDCKFSKRPHKTNSSTELQSGDFLSKGEKRKFCNDVQKIKGKHFLLTFPDSDPMGDLKSADMFDDIVRATKTDASKVTHATVVESIVSTDGKAVRETKIALEIQAKNAISVGGFLWKLYEMFPNYHRKIIFDPLDKSKYLVKARTLVAPLLSTGKRGIDMDPFVYGDGGTLEGILKRMENSARGVRESYEIRIKWHPRLARAARDARGCYLKFIQSEAYQEFEAMYPYQCRTAFDEFSRISDEDANEDTLGDVVNSSSSTGGEMEFVSVSTYIDNDWQAFWLGPTSALHQSKRLSVQPYRDELMRLQGSRCNYCKDPIRLYPSASCDCDHIIPVNYGGNCELDNLQLLCVPCHRLKSGMERRRTTRMVRFDGVKNGVVYAVHGGQDSPTVSGKIRPKDFVTMSFGVYEVDSKPGKVRNIVPYIRPPKKTKMMTRRGYVDQESPDLAAIQEELDKIKTEQTVLRERDTIRKRKADQIREDIRSLPVEIRKQVRSELSEEKKALDEKIGSLVSVKKQKREALSKSNPMQDTDKKMKNRRTRKIMGAASEEDHLVLRKEKVQKYFARQLTGEQVIFFEKHSRAIFNRVLFEKYPRVVRHKIHANQMKMCISDDYVSMDAKLVDILGSMVELIGLKSFKDQTTFDWLSMKSSGSTREITCMLDTMDEITKKVYPDDKVLDDLKRMRTYFKSVLGYNISRTQIAKVVDGVRTRTPLYGLTDNLQEILKMENTIMDMRWLEKHCEDYDEYVERTRGEESNEMAYMEEHMEGKGPVRFFHGSGS